MHLMTIMTVQHARNTETMRLYQLSDRCLFRCSIVVTINVCEKLDRVMPFLFEHLFVARLAREDWLVDVAVVEATLALHVLC